MDEIEQAREALGAWARAAGPVTEVEAAHQPPPGRETVVFAVVTARGDRFIFKNVAGSPGARRIEAEYDLLRHLHACGVPVAVPLLCDDGRVSLQAGERIYVLYPMLPADHVLPPADIERVYARIGAAVARLHRALATYAGQIDSWTMDLPRTVFEEAGPRIGRALAGHDAERFRLTMDGLRDEMVTALRGLPAQRIHGDCHGGNYLLYRGDVSGFCDLDHLPIGPRVYDVGYLLADMAKAQFFHNPAHRDWLDHFDAVVAGYDHENSLSRREKDALWFVMLATQVLFVDWFFQHDMPDLAAKNLEAFYWIYRHRDEITRRILCV